MNTFGASVLDPSIATVSPANGTVFNVTPVAPGATLVTVRDAEGNKAGVIVYVNLTIVNPASSSIPEFCRGQTDEPPSRFRPLRSGADRRRRLLGRNRQHASATGGGTDRDTIATAPPRPDGRSPSRSNSEVARENARRPAQLHQPSTGSVGVAVNGGAASYSAVSCLQGNCQVSVTVDAPVNQTDTFVVTAWTGPDGPNDDGILLSQGSAQAFITPGGTLNIRSSWVGS